VSALWWREDNTVSVALPAGQSSAVRCGITICLQCVTAFKSENTILRYYSKVWDL